MWSMQCNVEFGYQLSICSGAKGNHAKPWSSWSVAGPSGCKLTSSQQSGIKYVSPNINPYPCCCFFFSSPPLFLFLQVLFYKYFYVGIICIHKHQTVYNTWGRNERIYEQILFHYRENVYLYAWWWLINYPKHVAVRRANKRKINKKMVA
jgi:hypothetical protein